MDYKEEKMLKAKNVNDLCLELLKQLGRDWSEVKKENDYDNPNGEFITAIQHKNGAQPYFSRQWKIKEGRIEVGAYWPKADDGTMFKPDQYRNEELPSIGGSINKGFDKLAKDFIKRFINPYLELYTKKLEEAAKWNAHLNAKESLAKELATLLKEETREGRNKHENYIVKYFDEEEKTIAKSVTVTVHSEESVTFEVRVENKEMAKKLVNFLMSNPK